MLTTQETLDVNASIGIILNYVGPRLTGEFELTQYIENLRALGDLVPDHRINKAFKFYQDSLNSVFKDYDWHRNEGEYGSKERRYYSTCVMRMLLSHLFNGEGFLFETETPYAVCVCRLDTVFTISYYCTTTALSLSLDVWETSISCVMNELQKRRDWLEMGNQPADYPVQVKTNTYHPLKEEL